VAGLAISFGSGAMTNSIADIAETQIILLIGGNPDSGHPIIGLRLHQAVDRGAKLIVIDPRKTALAERADLWLRPRPGTDIALLNGFMHMILKEDLWDKKYVAERTENFSRLEAAVMDYPPERVSEITGVPVSLIEEAGRLYASPGKNSAIYYGMGLTHYSFGSNNVKSVANLAMLCGKVGMPGNGVNPLRGQNNVQGACDMGALYNTLPGYAGLTNDETFKKYEKVWGETLLRRPGKAGSEVWDFIRAGEKMRGKTLPRQPGKAGSEVWDFIHTGDVKALYIVGEDPVLSDPHITHVAAAVEKLDFLVVQDIFLSETAKKAHVVLPAACFAEKDGTFTNTERRVQRVRRAVKAPGRAKTDWMIFCKLSERMGYGMRYESPQEIFEEIRSLVPQYAGITYDRIEKKGLQWPVPDINHPGTPVLHTERFTRGKGFFSPEEYVPPKEMPDSEFPFLLTTGRELAQYNFGSMTRKTREIENICSEALAEINPLDAKRLGIEERSLLKLTSRRGSVIIRAKITEKSDIGTIFVPYHFVEVPINLLTQNSLDPLSKTPEYKVCAIKVEVLGESCPLNGKNR